MVEGKYSKDYRAVLEAMLASSPSQRIDFEGLIARLMAKKVNEIFKVQNEVVVVSPQEAVRVSFTVNRPSLPSCSQWQQVIRYQLLSQGKASHSLTADPAEVTQFHLHQVQNRTNSA
jgi:hypothetical protein